MNKKRFSTLLIDWYNDNKRDLPWRKTNDPYKIWLSEIMLQQTRVSQGLPYYKNFIKEFSSVQKLASAPEKKVMRLWQGLGYYSRARNLHKCSKIISRELHGKFPTDYSELLKLPGIGEYTASAIASIAFDKSHAVVDGNVFRVLARINGIDLDIISPKGKRYFFDLANSLIPKEQPGLFNQAMMEFGALHCTPKKPNCDECIFKKECVAFKTESQNLFPVKSKAAKHKKRYFNYFVIEKQGKIWMKERLEKDIWKGLHEFFLMESNKPLKDVAVIDWINEELNLNDTIVEKSFQQNQILSHQEIIAKFYEIKIDASAFTLNGGRFYSKKELDKIAKPVLITRYLESKP